MKKLICLLTIGVFTGETLLLTGCNGGSVSNKPGGALASANLNSAGNTGTASGAAQGKLAKPNDDDDLWVNVTRTDLGARDSRIAFLANNASGYDMQLVGCDSNSNVINNLRNIPSGSSPTMTMTYPKKWAFLDNGSGIYDSKHVYNSNLTFKSDISNDGNLACYYSINIPEAAQPMYVKLVNHWYKASSFEPVGDHLDKPKVDMENIHKTNWWLDFKKQGSAAVLAVINGFGSWAYFASKYTQDSISSYLGLRGNLMYADVADEITLNLTAFRENMDAYWRNLRGGNKEAAADSMRAATKNRLWFAERFPGGGGAVPEEGVLKMKNYNALLSKEGEYVTRVQYFGGTQPRFEMIVQTAKGEVSIPVSKSSRWITGEALPKNVAAELRRLNIADADSAGILKLFGKGKYANEYASSFFARNATLLNKFKGGEAFYRAASAARITTNALEIFSAVSLNVAIIAITEFVVMPAITGLFDEPAIGTAWTGVNHLKFENITAEDVKKWNGSHDAEHQIETNTTMTMIAKSSIMQEASFSFNNNKMDKQLAINIQLNSISNPWINYSEYSALEGREDPFRGWVGKNNKGGIETHKSDAVVGVTITDNRASSTKDIDYLYARSQMEYLGANSLDVDMLLPAPQYSVISMRDINSSQLLSTKDALITVNGITGLVLNDGEEVKLNVSLPKSKVSPQLLSLAADDKPLVGKGLSVDYVGQSESGSEHYMTVKSDPAFELLNTESSGLPLFYSKFDCSYPLEVGKECPLTLKISDPKKQGVAASGKLYLSDGNSHTTVIPVYLNMKLVSEPSKFALTEGDTGVHTVTLANYSNGEYNGVTVSGLPAEAQVLSNSCSGKVSAGGGQCSVSYDLSKLRAGNYNVLLNAQTGDKTIDPKNQRRLAIDVNSGWNSQH